MRTLIVVLGDLGRSPRMQYHALALADSQADVDVVAYEGVAPPRSISDHPRIRLRLIAPLSLSERSTLRRPVFIAYASARIAAQSVRLLRKVLTLPKPDVILIQNPPALPTLIIALIAARLRSSKLVVDWHNFSHSMLALRLGPDAWAVRALRTLEMALGRRAGAHLCVSLAMKLKLARDCAIPHATVFRDRPAAMFFATPPELRMKHVWRCVGGAPPILNGTRPAIIICPTSWTTDEDMSILIDAAARYDRRASTCAEVGESVLPPLLVLITGRGPLRSQYELKISAMKLNKVSIQTAWLPAEEYVSLIGSADLGISCHRSASGVDLAMKVADMFGAGIPVCALDYGPCLAEQVRHGENGLLFKDADQLADQLCELFIGFPAENPLLGSLRENVARIATERWNDGWKLEAAPVLLGGVEG